MSIEIARSTIQRIFKDKILAGLVIVGVLAIFVGGFGSNPHDRVKSGPRESRSAEQSRSQSQVSKPSAQEVKQAPQQPKVESATPALTKIEPALAIQFVEWWVVRAMDFNPETAIKNREEAMQWITPETAPSYQAAFYPAEITDGITSGRIQGSFTLSAVRAVAANPDGSIVVNVTGNLVLQQGQAPVVQQLSTDYLVKREPGGLRIAGLYNRAMLLQGSGMN